MKVFQLNSPCPWDCNIYLVQGSRFVLIDTGSGQCSEEVLSQIGEVLDGRDLAAVCLTHCHYDHAGGLFDIVQKYHCPAYIHESEISVLSNGDGSISVADMFGCRLQQVPCLPYPESGTIDLGEGECLQVIHTPGHTAGSICLYNESEHSLFSGDTVFAQGYGRIDFPTGSGYDIRNSISRLSMLNIGMLYSGHGPVITNGSASIRQTLSNMMW